MNLLSNAVKFTFRDHFRFKVYKIEHSDTGISNETKISLFQALTKPDWNQQQQFSFYCVLGLSISHVLSNLLGFETQGGIEIESIPNIGSTVSFAIIEKLAECHQRITTKKADQHLVSPTSQVLQTENLFFDNKIFDEHIP